MRTGRGTLRLAVLAFIASTAFPIAEPAAQTPPVLIDRFAGAPAPDLPFLSRDGTPHRFSEFRGRLVLVNLWASWCAPCRVEMPALERLAQAYPDDLVVLAISQDRQGWPAIDRFWDVAHFATIKSVLAADPALAQHYGVLGLPYSVLLDRDGREIGRLPRAGEWDKGALRALVDRASR